MDAERQEDIVFQIGQSKAERNVIMKTMPGWLIEKAITVAEQAEIQQLKNENPAFARAKVLDYFERWGVSEPQLVGKIGRPVDRWTAEDIATLRGMATAIKDGLESVGELFPEKVVDEEPDQTPPHATTEKSNGQKASERSPEKKPESGSGNTRNQERSAGQESSASDPAPADEWEVFKKEWVYLRDRQRLIEYVEDNLDRFKQAPEELQNKARQKWNKLGIGKHQAFPLDEQETQTANKMPETSDEGVNISDDEKSSENTPELAQEGEPDNFEDDQAQYERLLDEIDALKQRHPQQYLTVAKGRKPANVDEARMLIDNVRAKIEMAGGPPEA